jgi:hypothetical protein
VVSRFYAGEDRRRAEDRIRDERHDALAKSICAGEYAEKRQHRAESVLRAEREEDEKRWRAAQGDSGRKNPRGEKARGTRRRR